MKMEIAENEESQAQIRSMTSELSVLSRCDGSCYFHQGNTSVMSAVYGPGEVQLRHQIIDKATVEVILRPKIGMPGCAEKLQERLVRNTCETVILAALHPRSAITIVLQVMQDSGSLLACSINAACLALLDAAVPMKYTMAAVSCIIDADGQIVLDPVQQEEEKAAASLCCTFCSTDMKIVNMTTKGSFSNQQLQACVLACKNASSSIFQFHKDTMRRKLSKEIK